jgi:aspartyl-tRNA(Asn)/glutamyl-tRNA(Gln) amidotransferase subunit A
LIGKTTCPEFVHKAITDSPLLGLTRNPWKLDRSPGGSSGGAAAAVAAGLGPLAVGADGAGSNRIPSSCTGIVGLKPTCGLIPYPQAPDLFGNLSTIGPLTRTVSDAALMLSVMAGPDASDPISYRTHPVPYDFGSTIKNLDSLKKRKIAWSPNLGNKDVDHEVLKITETAVNLFASFGCEIEYASPSFESPEAAYMVIFYSALACRLGEYVGKFHQKMDSSLLYAIEKGNQFSAKELQSAIYKRSTVAQIIQHFFEKFDLLITPTLTTPALSIKHSALDPVVINGKITTGSLRSTWYPYTYPFNMAGNPAISIPCGWTTDNLPVGLQIVGPWFGEELLLQAAAAFELEKPWAGQRPALPNA